MSTVDALSRCTLRYERAGATTAAQPRGRSAAVPSARMPPSSASVVSPSRPTSAAHASWLSVRYRVAPPATTASVQSRRVPDERAAPAVARSSSVLPATIGSFERSAAAGSVRAIVCGATMSYRGTCGMWMRSRKSSRRTTWLSASRGATSSSQPVGSSATS